MHGPNVEQRRLVILVVSEDHYFVSHRLELARAIRAAGFDVRVLTRVHDTARADRLAEEGIVLEHVDVARARLFAPLADAAYCAALLRAYRAHTPALVHHVAMKPVLYGSIAAALAGVPTVNALAGLGYLYTSDAARVRAVRALVGRAFRVLFQREESVLIVQNADDYALFRERFGLDEARLVMVRGAGVDTSTFAPDPGREPGAAPVFVMVSRMLRDKGVRELVEAARRLRAEGAPLVVRLVGGVDAQNPNSLTEHELRAAVDEGAVEWLGHRDDVPAQLARADVAVLPSYREGLPKSLLEAAACGLPIIATDVPGCREVVRHGVSGLLVPPRSADGLVTAMRTLAADPDLRARMGQAGRELVVRELSQTYVAEQTLRTYSRLLATNAG